MKTLVVLFNLKPGVDIAEYEEWARRVDLPTVRGLGSVAAFEVLKAQGLLGGGPAPYAYVELIRVRDLDGLFQDIATPTMQKVASEFQGFADQPLFLITDALE